MRCDETEAENQQQQIALGQPLRQQQLDEQRPERLFRQLQRRLPRRRVRVQVRARVQQRSRDAGRPLGAQDEGWVGVLQGVHFFADDVGGGAQCTVKQRAVVKGGCCNFRRPVLLHDRLGDALDVPTLAVGVVQEIMRAAGRDEGGWWGFGGGGGGGGGEGPGGGRNVGLGGGAAEEALEVEVEHCANKRMWKGGVEFRRPGVFCKRVDGGCSECGRRQDTVESSRYQDVEDAV